MTKRFIVALGTTVLLATAAGAQTNPAQPDKQLGCPDAGVHNSMLPAVRPGEKPKSCAGKTLNTKPVNTPPSSSQGAATVPDQGKPGVMPSDDNTTKMHMPGSENQQAEGPTGAPKH